MPKLSATLLSLLAIGITGSSTQPAPPPAPQAAARPARPWANTSWLNSAGRLSLESLRGRVVLLNFWVFTCVNCTRTVPSLVRFDRIYREQGLTIIGIHTPEFPPYAGEHDKANVARALTQYNIEYPNAQDNDNTTWNLYGIRYWPSFILIDKKGDIRYEDAGEFHVGDATDRLWQERIQALLAEAPATGLAQVILDQRGGVPSLELLAPGLRINALVPPALEFSDGSVLRLTRGARTHDSAYFAEPPWAVPLDQQRGEAVLRLSYCQASERVCRSVSLPVTVGASRR